MNKVMKHKWAIIAGLVILAVTLCAILLAVSGRYQTAQSELRMMQRAEQDMRDHIKALYAEWSYLSRPQRLESLGQGIDPDAETTHE